MGAGRSRRDPREPLGRAAHQFGHGRGRTANAVVGRGLLEPAEHLERHAWRQAVEAAATELRRPLSQPAFGLPQPEIPIYDHRRIGDFVALVARRAGLF